MWPFPCLTARTWSLNWIAAPSFSPRSACMCRSYRPSDRCWDDTASQGEQRFQILGKVVGLLRKL